MAENPLIKNLEALAILAPVATAPIRHHVFVCTGKSCSAVDSAEVKSAFERELISRELLFGKAKKGKNPNGSILVTECGSVGFCAIGAAVMVYPDGIWYAQVRAGRRCRDCGRTPHQRASSGATGVVESSVRREAGHSGHQ